MLVSLVSTTESVSRLIAGSSFELLHDASTISSIHDIKDFVLIVLFFANLVSFSAY